ncbi:MAG: type III-A CRISPR-associated RAMP protein Csm5 [Candidatus Accumulibacter sp.]|uniref:type III-A CRISPR-associated RAMP protein Csm5 n=1 Tax=Accumulibacter sp. TaxID=2053492 RepID=UPI001A4E12CC|nr:type III-A CRISPR-associated RAMP protein Csm5 [Accumulibacter sp.]MBL8393476.1 type III-A CRISPR-associated RAMP protein Csm5 [Accumulibacter sp.]
MTKHTRPLTRSLAIWTLSPVHVGCGEVYEPSGFVIHEGLLHVLDPADLADSLSDDERKRLTATAKQPEPIGAIQRFFRDGAARFAELATQQVAVAGDLAREYATKAGRPTHRDPGGEPTYNLFPIARTAFRPFDGTPYLPGSSLKGSIRTAWLNHLNANSPLNPAERADRQGAARSLEQRLLGYAAGQFENDPFRHLALADAHPEDDSTPPPTRVLYAISKKKRPPRDDERPSPELKVFLETIPEALPASFLGEMRFGPSATIPWEALCDACNGFYRPQLEAELQHPVLGALLDSEWARLIYRLLGEELDELMAARQGFLLRVGRHSGAESVTLGGLRNIKILGPRVDGKQTSDFRPATTEKRYASLTRSGNSGLLPFGWIWVDACDDRHRHLSDAVQQQLASRSGLLREAHQDRLLRLREKQAQRAATAATIVSEKQARAVAARAEAEAEAKRQCELALMNPDLRRIEEFKTDFAARAKQLRGKQENANAVFHAKAKALARDAAAWPQAERRAAADAIEHWLPQVVKVDIKDERRKLKLAALRAP